MKKNNGKERMIGIIAEKSGGFRRILSDFTKEALNQFKK
jgi:hypothetical protein